MHRSPPAWPSAPLVHVPSHRPSTEFAGVGRSPTAFHFASYDEHPTSSDSPVSATRRLHLRPTTAVLEVMRAILIVTASRGERGPCSPPPPVLVNPLLH